jgi:uncharacterized membrane protein
VNVPATSGRRPGLLPLVLVGSAGIGVLAAGYLSVVKLTGGLPACGPVQGCETVALSQYSEVLGIPVALLGLAFSAVLLSSAVVWIRTERQRLLYATYALSLFGVAFVGYLTYLEIFVIHAICIWCVAYAVSVVTTFLATAMALRRSP